jgi:hypothetical protein
MSLLVSSGKISFDPVHYTKKHNAQGSWKKTAMITVNDDMAAYYSWYVQRRYGLKLNPPLRGTHVTFINDRITSPYLLDKYEMCKDKYEGKIIEFTYDTDVRTNAEHWWLKVNSNDMLYIRDEIGIGKPFFGLHLTIGIVPKDDIVRKKHSEYIHGLIREGMA